MSSEMREVDAFEAWARAQCFGAEELRRIEGRPANTFGLTWEYNGDSVQAAWAAWLERALLARTEAGADGAVAWRVEWDEDNDGDAFYVTLDTERGAMGRANEAIAEGFKGVRIRRLVYGDTHPQDASGDAAMLDWLDQQAADGVHVEVCCTGNFDARTIARKATVYLGRPQSEHEAASVREAIRNAMQAKEAK